MPRNKKRQAVPGTNRKVIRMGEENTKPKALPWYATTPQPKQGPQLTTIDNKTLVEWNTARWVKKLMAVCEKIGTSVIDPKVMTHTPIGSLVMEWEIGNKFLQVLIFAKDTYATISYLGDDGELLAETPDGWSQGPVDSEEDIERVWKWLLDHPDADTSFLSELFAVTRGGIEDAGLSS